MLKERERLLSIALGFPSVVIFYGLIVAAYLGLGIGDSLQAGISAAIVWGGVAGILALPIIRFIKRPIRQVIYIFFVALTIFSATIVAGHTPHKPWIDISNVSHPTPGSTAFNNFILLAVAVAAIGVVQFMSSYALTFVFASGRIRNSDIIIISTLVHVLHMTDKKTSRSDDISIKTWICSHLQYAAYYMEEGIPHALALPDSISRQAFQAKLTNGASYLRELQLWVALAKDGAQNDTRDAVAHCIELIAQGKYDALPVGTLEGLKGSETSKLIKLGRALAVAIIPFACLISVRYAGLKLSSNFTGWAVIISLAWAAITLIAAIDPLYKTRLKDMQDLISTIRGKDQ